jgi:hypothetical protein
MIKFQFIISKWGIFYFFVQNLSEWHFSYRKKYNVLWQKELGSLSSKEKKALKVFKKIRSKYKTTRTCFEKAFFTKKNPWQSLAITLDPREYQEIQKVFIIFQNKFEKFYSQEYPLLEQWQKLLSKTANQTIMNRKITKILDNLYGTNFINKDITINVYLLPSTHDTTGGGANIDNKSISLEISRYPQEKNNHALGILWHEIIHLLFQKKFFLIILKNISESQNADFINEIITSALFPKGLLGQQFFNHTIANYLNPSLSSQQTYLIFKLIKNYLHNSKALDIYCIKKLKAILSSS